LDDARVQFAIETHTSSDGYAWRYRRYLPSGAPRAHVVCLHGIQSHAGWYEYSCTRLSEAGFAVSFLDRRGCGMNQQDRGDAPSFRRLLDDIAEFIWPLPRPVFLVAISWGGKLGVAFQRRHQGIVDGLALLCPGIFPKAGTPFLRRLLIAARRLLTPRKLFPIPLSEPELFTDTPRWQQFIRQDPLGLHQATARLMVESVRLDAYLRFVPRYVKVPVLLMLAEKDRIINNSRTRRYVERFPSSSKRIVEYSGAHHTLEFDPEPDRFVADLVDWLGSTGSVAETPLNP
jgi:alpha-beta hydrolase superfamily lysophospholipase